MHISTTAPLSLSGVFAHVLLTAVLTRFWMKCNVVQLSAGEPRIGYLLNMLPTTLSTDDGVELAALDLYFMQQDGETFKASITHKPYFYVACKPRFMKDVNAHLTRQFEGSFLDALTYAYLDPYLKPSVLNFLLLAIAVCEISHSYWLLHA